MKFIEKKKTTTCKLIKLLSEFKPIVSSYKARSHARRWIVRVHAHPSVKLSGSIRPDAEDRRSRLAGDLEAIQI